MSIEESFSYSMEFRTQNSALCVPLLVWGASEDSWTLWRNPVLGLSIQSIEVDGTKIEAQDYDVDYDEFDLSTMEATSKWYGYQIIMQSTEDEKAYRLVTARWVTEDDFILIAHLIPESATDIRIQYRPRYPIDVLGAPLRAFSERNDISAP